MKKINYIFLILVLLVGVSSCKNVDFGDINDNPNGTSTPDASALMSAAMLTYSTVSGRDGLTRPALYVQYQSQVTYTSEMRYSNVAASWYTYYVNIMNNLNEVIDLNTNQQTPLLASQGAFENQIGAAQIFKAIVMKRVTDTWGNAPYSEAFQGLDNFTPKYDSQESIYKALIGEVKSARDSMNPSKKGPTGDIIFNGNVSNWQKLANSLLMQMSLQLANKYPSASGYAATEFNSALSNSAGVIDAVSSEAWFRYFDIAGQRNPWSLGRTRDYFMTQEITDALKGNVGDDSLNPTSNHTADPRIKVYAKSATKDGVAYGYRNGKGSGKNQMSTAYWWKSDASLPLHTASYSFLNRAEAASKGWTSEDAVEMLKKGIQLSFISIDANKKTAIVAEHVPYLEARLADVETVGLDQVIGEEKWISLYPNGFDAWAEWRRTKVPALKPATDYLNNGTIPMRYIYPSEESSTNKSNYEQGLQGLTPNEDLNSSAPWWAQ